MASTSKILVVLLFASPVYTGAASPSSSVFAQLQGETQNSHLFLLQAAARGLRAEDVGNVSNPTRADPASFAEFAMDEDNEGIGDTCGTRAIMPQLQFALEVYREMGLLSSRYQKCSMPSVNMRRLAVAAAPATTQELFRVGEMSDALSSSEALVDIVPERAGFGKSVIRGWGVVTMAILVASMWGVYAVPKAGKDKMVKVARKPLTTFAWFSLSWLDPIIGRYGWSDVPKADAKELESTGPDLRYEPYESLRDAWEDELAARGDGADLGRTVRRFVGARAAAWVLCVAGATAFLEFVGMTVVLDVLLNYLHWISEARAKVPLLHFDIVAPTVMVIVLGFGVPLTTRAFSTAMNLFDGYHTNRIVSGLMMLTRDKCQRVPVSRGGSGSDDDPDLTHLLSNDVVKVWSGVLKAHAYLVVSPMCALILVGVLFAKLGWPAILGAVMSLWLLVLYFPIVALTRRFHIRWEKDADSRIGRMREFITNFVVAKATCQDEINADVLEKLRERELSSKFRFSLVQSLLSVPFGAFPYALVSASLVFCSLTGTTIGVAEIFVCMQVLSGLSSCLQAFTTSAQKVMTLPYSIARVQGFLLEQERPRIAQESLARHPDAPHVHVKGSFAYQAGGAPVLSDVDFVAGRGELVAVVGGVASGKSALLDAVRGELAPTDTDASVQAPSAVAYCAQTPCVADVSIDENVTLGEPLDKTRYAAALAAASINDPALTACDETGDTSHIRHEETGPANFPYFTLWNFAAVTCLALSIMNIKWDKSPFVLGGIVVAVQGILHWSVLEIPLQTIAALFIPRRKLARADGSHLKAALNYNLLAVSEADVDECMTNMYEAYVGNLGARIAAVLVSATNDPELQQYELKVRDDCREKLCDMLRHEGRRWAGLEAGSVDSFRAKRFWAPQAGSDKEEFVRTNLEEVCQRAARNFMVLHRVSRVLRKCGQYQDLMLLASGERRAFTYCDQALYGKAARNPDEELFHPSEDAENVCGFGFDFTLVLDADTRVVPDSVFDMLDIAAAYPDRALIQPAIKMDCGPGDTLFMHLEAMRQEINAPLSDTITSILGQSGFCGKALIRNTTYIERCLGTREKLIEAVPIDVLSHDTFEAAVLKPMFAGEVHLLEAPCGNYVTWDIRERRWNRGELLLAMYFFPAIIGEPFRWLQRVFQGKTYVQGEVRTKTELDKPTAYLAHAALRQIVMKPMLVTYIVMVDFVEMKYSWLPILTVMFAIIVFPKVATCTKDNARLVLLETAASILQFTPESVVGTIRVLRALRAHLTGNARWVPQRAVEEEFKQNNPFVFCLRYLWYYLIFAIGCGYIVISLIPEGIFIMSMLGTLFSLPLYAGFTALTVGGEGSGQRFPYFGLWNFAAVGALVLSTLNVRWSDTDLFLGILVVAVQGVLHWSVLEIPLQTIAAFFVQPQPVERKNGSHLKVALNYNLLAVSKEDVDECMQNMYEAYMGNLGENICAVLVSATNDPELKEYELQVRDDMREKIHRELYQEGMAWAGQGRPDVDLARAGRLWSRFQNVDRREFAESHLDGACRQIAQEFMVVHRVSRVLRKCGQYQDLMLLSAGDDKAYTYCDTVYYGSSARKLDEPLFNSSQDTDSIRGRMLDYTLVLDSDTRVEAGSVAELMDIAAAHPDRAVIQPSIKMDVSADDSVFMHIEAMRQQINEPMTTAITTILGQSGFYGKGLLKNSVYIEKCLGTREKLVEAVPIDVLSHDTFEAAVLTPMYAGDVHLLEAPCGNYVTWDIRERRWNRGEVLLAMYFFPRLIGEPFRWIQGKLQGKRFEAPKLRTETEHSHVTSYMAHAALRQMVLKPLLVSYIVLVDFVTMHHPWLPILTVMFAIIVFPKLAVANRSNIKAVLLETAASILQFTPESVVGTIRVLRSLRAHLTGNARWVPQRAVEDEFRQSNPFVFSMRYLWYYLAFAVCCGYLVVELVPDGFFIMTMLGTLFALPLYAGFTAMPIGAQARAPAEKKPFPYFRLWDATAAALLALSVANVQWETTDPILGVIVIAVQGALHWSVLEIPLQVIATFFVKAKRVPRADGSALTAVLNYNLLAVSKADVDECMENMLEAFMGSMREGVAAVLVSATNDPELKEYELKVRDECRERVYKTLYEEGLSWAGFKGAPVDASRYVNIWQRFANIDRHVFVKSHLDGICQQFAREFMVVQRVSRVLRKCGQYQDLILLSAGEDKAYTYCDANLYGASGRPYNQPLFYDSKDTDNVRGRHFDYTLVLDADTRVVPGSLFTMMDIAAASPDRTIIQPAIKMDVSATDSIFMHIEAMRQSVNAPMSDTITSILNESGFYGKGLIKNSGYIEKCLGTREKLIEAVPIDVLSHDTFEASICKPMYAGDVHLLEAPCNNYVTWDIRERRWNRGEILLAMYFFPRLCGAPMRAMQSWLQGKTFHETKVRTVVQHNKVTSYMAHAALRQIAMKPLLVSYIILVDFVDMYYQWLPILSVMFAIIIFPKLVTCNKSNIKAVLLETSASILQFTPEAVVGTVRVLRSLRAHLTGNARWVPQRAVEEEFKQNNPFIFSLRYLWYYLVFAVLCGGLVMSLVPEGIFIMLMLGTLFSLPLYAGFTACSGANMGASAAMQNQWQAAPEGMPAWTQPLLALGPPEAEHAREGPRALTTDAMPLALAAGTGPRGGQLSAGERAQVALARAAYCRDADLVLLDDPLAAVDGATGTHILHKLIRGPLLTGRTRIVAMRPNDAHLRHFDRVVVLDGGRVVAQGSPAEVLAGKEFQQLQALTKAPQAPRAAVAAAKEGGSVAPVALEGRPVIQEVEEDAQIMSADSVILGCCVEGGGAACFVLAVACAALVRLLVQSQLLVLGRWADKKQAGQLGDDIRSVRMLVLLLLGVGLLQFTQSALVLSFNHTFSRNLFRKAFAGLRQASPRRAGVLATHGLLGRLSADVLTIDTALSTGFSAIASFFFSVIVLQVYCFSIVPWWLMIPFYVAVAVFVVLFFGASSPLQHCAAAALARCQEGQAEALRMGASSQVLHVAEYAAQASAAARSTFLGVACVKQWLVVRLTVCLCFQCTLCVLWGLSSPDDIGVGTLAVVVASTFSIMQELDCVVDSMVVGVTTTVALQRLRVLCSNSNNVDEAAGSTPTTAGDGGVRVQLQGLRVGYTDALDAVQGLTADVPAGARCCLVGPAGAGKSAALLSVAGVLEAHAGRVLVGGKPAVDSRNSTGYAPQRPALFQGTIRFNVDPKNTAGEQRIWECLQRVQLADVVRSLEGGLNHVLPEDGASLSLGQQQLLCLARALCQRPSLLLMDDCMSALNARTRDEVLKAVFDDLSHATILLATQHVEVASAFETVVVLEGGIVKEQGSPRELLTNAKSAFAGMAALAGME